MAQNADGFEQRGVQVLIVVPQEPFRAGWWKEKLNLPFTLVADPTAWTCSTYGVAKQLVVHDEWVNIPAAFVIDKQGVLRYSHVGTAFNDRATAEELLEAVDRLGE